LAIRLTISGAATSWVPTASQGLWALGGRIIYHLDGKKVIMIQIDRGINYQLAVLFAAENPVSAHVSATAWRLPVGFFLPV